MTNYNEIDNPLPDQVMRQMDADAEEQACKKECFERAKEICEMHSVLPELIEDFQEWAWSTCLDADSFLPSAGIIDDGKDDIDAWWESEGEYFDDYDSPYSMADPTPQYLYDNTGGEPPISAEERNRNSLDSKRESHGHRYYSNSW